MPWALTRPLLAFNKAQMWEGILGHTTWLGMCSFLGCCSVTCGDCGCWRASVSTPRDDLRHFFCSSPGFGDLSTLSSKCIWGGRGQGTAPRLNKFIGAGVGDERIFWVEHGTSVGSKRRHGPWGRASCWLCPFRTSACSCCSY